MAGLNKKLKLRSILKDWTEEEWLEFKINSIDYQPMSAPTGRIFELRQYFGLMDTKKSGR